MPTKKDLLFHELVKHSDDRGRVTKPLDEIRQAVNQDRHDAMKNVHDLARSGFIQYTTTSGDGKNQYADTITILKVKSQDHARRTRVDRSTQLLEFLEQIGGEDGKWVSFDAGAWCAALDCSYETLMTTIRKLDGQNVFDIEYKGHGSRSGLKRIRVLKWLPSKFPPLSGPPPQATAPQIVAVSAPTTPILKRYRVARDFALKHPDNEFIKFEPDAGYDEALAFIDFITLPSK
jgi:hypothetical protein